MLPSQDPPGRFSFLRSPLVFGGVALVIGVVMGVVVALMIAGGGDNGDESSVVRRDSTPSPAPTEDAEETPEAAEVVGRATATISVHSGPGSNYQALGTIPRDKEVEIIGQDEDGEWLEVYFLPPSRLTGWVSASLLEIEGEMARVPLATPEVIAQPEVPTVAPPPEEPTEEPTGTTPTATVEATATATEAAGQPDLVIRQALVVGATLVITVTNQGVDELKERVVQIGVFDARDSRLLQTANSGPHTLAPGESIDVPTGYDVRGGPSRLLVIVDAQGQIEEADDTNNRLIFTVSVPTPTPVPTTPPATEVPAATATPTPTTEANPSPTPFFFQTPTPTPFF